MAPELAQYIACHGMRAPYTTTITLENLKNHANLRENALDSSELKKAGLKATLPRLRILEVLEKSEEQHLSAEDVYKALLDNGEDVGLATIYRVLTQFEAAGIVDRHNFDEGHAVFEIAREDHHDHIVNIDTGEVIEFVDEEIERRQREIVEQRGFKLEDHNLVLYVREKKQD
jgi:Fur family transcriptional regulator, ferric uptake regulator